MNKLNLIWILVLLCVSFTIAQDSAYIFKQGEVADLVTSCATNTSGICGTGTDCYITVIAPDSSIIIDNGTMTNKFQTYNYTLNSTQTSQVGEYSNFVYCSGDHTVFGNFNHLITKSGENPSTAISLIYMGLFMLLIILFVLAIWGIFSITNIYGKFTLLIVSYMLLVAVSFTGWHLASNFLNNSPFIISMTWIIFRVLLAGILPFFLGSFIWLFFEFRKLQQIKSLIEKGVPEDEAFARSMKGGRSKW